MAERQGKGNLVNCPYDNEKLDFEDQEVHSSEIYEMCSCPKCHRNYQIRYVAADWKEVH